LALSLRPRRCRGTRSCGAKIRGPASPNISHRCARRCVVDHNPIPSLTIRAVGCLQRDTQTFFDNGSIDWSFEVKPFSHCTCCSEQCVGAQIKLLHARTLVTMSGQRGSNIIHMQRHLYLHQAQFDSPAGRHVSAQHQRHALLCNSRSRRQLPPQVRLGQAELQGWPQHRQKRTLRELRLSVP
jgi:hypothetical protein